MLAIYRRAKTTTCRVHPIHLAPAPFLCKPNSALARLLDIDPISSTQHLQEKPRAWPGQGLKRRSWVRCHVSSLFCRIVHGRWLPGLEIQNSWQLRQRSNTACSKEVLRITGAALLTRRRGAHTENGNASDVGLDAGINARPLLASEKRASVSVVL